MRERERREGVGRQDERDVAPHNKGNVFLGGGGGCPMNISMGEFDEEQRENIFRT